MTRINLPPPPKLTDQHLGAEYYELPRAFPLALAAAKRGDLSGPRNFVLGEGHVRFFYRRTAYLAERHAAIVAELLDQGFDLKFREPLTPVAGSLDWVPGPADLALSLGRLRERLHAPPRPEFYTYRGEPVGLDFYGGEA